MSFFKNPWTTLSSKVAYENRWIRAEHHQVLTPKGDQGIYGKVHFKNYAIGIIPIDQDGFTYLVGQYRYPLDEYSWEIPMGGGPINQDILSSAKRELKEETGITANDWSYLMKMHLSNCVSDEVGHVFLARELEFGQAEWDDTEELEVKKIRFTEAVNMALNEQITDAVSIAGILKAQIFLKEL